MTTTYGECNARRRKHSIREETYSFPFYFDIFGGTKRSRRDRSATRREYCVIRCSECFTKPKRVSRKNVTRMAAGSAPLPTEKAQKIGEKCAKNARKALKRTLYPRTGYSTPAVMCDDDASLNRITTIFTWRL